MAINNTIPINEYTASGSNTIFAYSYKIFETGDMKVYLDGVLQGSGFTVVSVGNPGGGDVIFSVAPTAGVKVRLERDIPEDRQTDYIEGGSLPADVLDDDIDRTVAMIQELDYSTLQRLPGSNNWDAEGNRIINVADPIDPQDAVTQNFADAVLAEAEAWALEAEHWAIYPEDSQVPEGNIGDFSSLHWATKSDDSAVASAGSAAAAAADLATFQDVYLGALATAPVSADGGDLYYNTSSGGLFYWDDITSAWVATSAVFQGVRDVLEWDSLGGTQSTFNVVYNIGIGVDVFVNGNALNEGADYTASNGTTVVLTVAAIAGDAVRIVAYGNFTVGSGGAGGTKIEVAQAAHGFVTGEPIGYNGTSYFSAQANAIGTLALGVVEIIDSNSFFLVQSGLLEGLAGLTPGAFYYVSDTVTGAVQTVEPTSGFSNPVFMAVDATSAIVVPWRAGPVTVAGGGGGGGEANTGSNLGTGEGVFGVKVSSDLRFKSLIGGNNTSLSSDASEITIDVATATGSSLGTGDAVFSAKVANDLQFKSLKAGTNITLTPSATEILIDASTGGSGEANTASNVGAGGIGVFKQKSGVDLEFKNIAAASGKILVANDVPNNQVNIDVVESVVDHNQLNNYVLAQHRIINDAGTLTTELFSASEIISRLSGKSSTSHNHTGVYQPLDSDLTAIAALAPTKGNLMVGNGSAWVAVGVGTNGQVLEADSVQAAGLKWETQAGGSSDIQFSKWRTNNQSISNNTTLQDDTQLQVSNLPQGKYDVELCIYVLSDPAADVKFGWTVTNENLFIGDWSFPDSGGTNMQYALVDSDTDVTVCPTQSFTTPRTAMKFKGTLSIALGTNAGVIKFRFAQNVSNANATQITAGSMIKITKID